MSISFGSFHEKSLSIYDNSISSLISSTEPLLTFLFERCLLFFTIKFVILLAVDYTMDAKYLILDILVKNISISIYIYH